MRASVAVALVLLAGPQVSAAAPVANIAPRQAPLLVQGLVTNVRPGNGGTVLQVRTGQRMNNVGGANIPAVTVRSFTLGPGTRYEVMRSGLRTPATAAMLRPGQRVIVQAQGQQATGVHIMASARGANRRRGSYYSARRNPFANYRHIAYALSRTKMPHLATPKAAKTPAAHHHASVTRAATHAPHPPAPRPTAPKFRRS